MYLNNENKKFSKKKVKSSLYMLKRTITRKYRCTF